MSGVGYRDAGTDDAALLADLARRCFTETFGHLYRAEDLALFLERHVPHLWEEELASSDFAVRLVFEGDVAIGYAKLGPPSLPFKPIDHALELRQLYVLATHHGSGAGKALMDWTIAEAKARGADSLYLSVFTDNHRARRFYARQGFAFVQLYAFMVGTHADEDHILRLDLKARP